MVLGAFIDAGVDPGQLIGMLKGLEPGGWDLTFRQVLRGGLKGTHAGVSVKREESHRHLADVRNIISGSNLPERVMDRSIRAFEKLAEAESEAHGIPPEEVHFHETGALDAIIDIVGSFCCLHIMSIDRVFSSPVATGTGTVECQHGTIPVPSPATCRILEGIPTVPSGIRYELTTPTGAAILTTAVDHWSELPRTMVMSSTGYGAGDRDLQRPNLLRVTIGQTPSEEPWEEDSCVQLRTIIDDMDPRIWPDVVSGVLDRGAVDCYGVMCIGRKGRPAMEMTVLSPEQSVNDVLRYVFSETTTLGIRVGRTSRVTLRREFTEVDTPYGRISVKLAFLDGELLRAEPEYQVCASAARRHGVPVSEVIHAARCKARDGGEAT
jgi:uncharacterized protein (TIGR00299 family) protein